MVSLGSLMRQLNRNDVFRKRLYFCNALNGSVQRWNPDIDYSKPSAIAPIISSDDLAKKFKLSLKNDQLRTTEKQIRKIKLKYKSRFPLAHRRLRTILELDEEPFSIAPQKLGLISRGTKKTKYQPNTQELILSSTDYGLRIHNQQAYAIAMQKLLNVDIPMRVKAMRTLLGEITRLLDRLLCGAGHTLEIRCTPFWIHEGNNFLNSYERFSSAKVKEFSATVRPGGVTVDIPEGFLDLFEFSIKLSQFLDTSKDTSYGIRSAAAGTNDQAIVRTEDEYGTGFRLICHIRETRQSSRRIQGNVDRMRTGADTEPCMWPKKIELILRLTVVMTKASVEDLLRHHILAKGFPALPSSTYDSPNGNWICHGGCKPYRCGFKSIGCARAESTAMDRLTNDFLVGDLTAIEITMKIGFSNIDQ